MKGNLVSFKNSMDDCERILNDEFKDHPKSALYMISAINAAKIKTYPEKLILKFLILMNLRQGYT
jgi:F-type H+-transporting ATPase subunit beta